MSSDNGTDFLAGFLLGAVAGAAMALLFAPQTGEETRRQLKERGIELKDKADEISAQVRERAEEASARSRIVLEERVAQLEEAVAEGKKAAEKTKKELMAKLEAARSGQS